jgi:hypothetical protein
MDLSRTRVVLRERAVVDVLDLAIRFVVRHGVVYAKTAVLVLPPFVVASIFLARAGGWLATWTFCLFAGGLAGAPFTVLASRLVFEDDVRVSASILEAVRRAPRLFGLRIMTFLGGALGLTMLVVPGVWVLTLTFFVADVALVERARAMAALARCGRLVHRELVEVIVALLLLDGLHLAAVFSADSGGRAVIAALLESRAPAPIWNDGWSVLGLAGFWLFVPYAATARFLVYLDVRTRSEGWDIQTRFVALAALASSDAPPSSSTRRAA